MSEQRAIYRKLDFVDYFKTLTQTRDEWIAEFVARPRCLAALEAFATGQATLGHAAYFISKQYPVSREQPYFHPHILLLTLKQAARRHDLPKDDLRYIEVSSEIKREYAEILPTVQERLSGKTFWQIELPPADWTAAGGKWSSIRFEDEAQYIDYWMLANHEEYDRLFANRAILAEIDAYTREMAHIEATDHINKLIEIAGSCVPSLETRLRHVLFGRFSGNVRLGIIEVPEALKTKASET